MNSIANALNSRGTISWTEKITDLFDLTEKMSSSLTDINADPSACSLKWTSVYTASDDKVVETFLVKLETVSSVGVTPYSRYMESGGTFKFQVSPETYVVTMKTDAPPAGNKERYHKNKLKSQTKLPNEARVLFSDEQTANSVGDGIRRAVKTCAAKRSSP
jgi:hypothetical protein